MSLLIELLKLTQTVIVINGKQKDEKGCENRSHVVKTKIQCQSSIEVT